MAPLKLDLPRSLTVDQLRELIKEEIGFYMRQGAPRLQSRQNSAVLDTVLGSC